VSEASFPVQINSFSVCQLNVLWRERERERETNLGESVSYFEQSLIAESVRLTTHTHMFHRVGCGFEVSCVNQENFREFATHTHTHRFWTFHHLEWIAHAVIVSVEND